MSLRKLKVAKISESDKVSIVSEKRSDFGPWAKEDRIDVIAEIRGGYIIGYGSKKKNPTIVGHFEEFEFFSDLREAREKFGEF